MKSPYIAQLEAACYPELADRDRSAPACLCRSAHLGTHRVLGRVAAQRRPRLEDDRTHRVKLPESNTLRSAAVAVVRKDFSDNVLNGTAGRSPDRSLCDRGISNADTEQKDEA